MNISFDKPKVVFKDDYGKYTIGVSKKNQDGTYDNAYFPIEFNKGDEIPNKSVVNIKNAWFTFYKWDYEGKKGVKFFIKTNDYEIVENIALVEQKNDVEQVNESDPYADFGKEISIEDDENLELPF